MRVFRAVKEFMLDPGIHAVQLILLLLLLFVVVISTLARKLKTPYPIVLVVAGLLLGFVPGIPKVTLDPGLVFFVVLPPLLYSAAWLTSWRDFRHNFVNIASLAIGLVAFTVLGVAAAASWLVAGFDWRVGFVLGAVVATTDSIAATSIARRIGLPKRYSRKFQRMAVERLRTSEEVGVLAQEWGVTRRCLYKWRADHLRSVGIVGDVAGSVRN